MQSVLHGIALMLLVWSSAALVADATDFDESNLQEVPVSSATSPPAGRYDGLDIQAGLTRCAELGGCRLRLGAGVIEDVAIELGTTSPYGCRKKPCYPKGLVIEGAGRGQTIMRQKLPVRKGGEVFRTSRNPPDDLHFRSFTCDGRKGEQPGTADWKYGKCILISSRFVSPSDRGSIRDLHVKDFLLWGIAVRDARDWIIADNLIENIGCDDLAQPCHPDWNRSNPGCNGSNFETPLCPFQDPARWFPYSMRTSVVGHGIYLPGSSATRPRGHVVRNNIVRGVTKSCVTLFSGNLKLVIEDIRIEDNDISDCGMLGISIFQHAKDVVVRNNRLGKIGYSTNLSALGIGIGCATAAKRLTVEDNTLESIQGEGMNLACALDNSVIRRNTIRDPCQATGKKRQPGFGIDVGAMKPEDRGHGTTLLDGNVVTGAEGCRAALRVRNIDRLDVRGGRYEGGKAAVALVESAEHVVFEGGVALEGGDSRRGDRAPVGVMVESAVHSGRLHTSTQIRGVNVPRRVAPQSGFVACRREEDPTPGCR